MDIEPQAALPGSIGVNAAPECAPMGKGTHPEPCTHGVKRARSSALRLAGMAEMRAGARPGTFAACALLCPLEAPPDAPAQSGLVPDHPP